MSGSPGSLRAGPLRWSSALKRGQLIFEESVGRRARGRESASAGHCGKGSGHPLRRFLEPEFKNRSDTLTSSMDPDIASARQVSPRPPRCLG